MKLLVVSLLRLGDILLATSVLRSLRREYPRAEIHILINGQFISAARLIPYVNKVYGFDRDGIQQIIGMVDRGLLEAYFRVEDLVEQLQTERYDQVINLTHNRLSGWLTALVGCEKTQGVVFGADGKFSVGSGWFEYLNDFGGATGNKGGFHFVDVFHYGTGLDASDRRIELKETADGKKRAAEILAAAKGSKKILLQPGSAETKKTFTSKKWRQIGTELQENEKDAAIFVMGSSQEEPILKEICDGTPFIPAVCDLEGAFSLLQQGNLLITGDTSIKHLAAATKIRILEISLGSSEYQKTGAYVSGAVIVQGLAACAPCSHRTPCTQKSHECADRISPELITLIAGAMIRQDEVALRVLAHEFKDEALILKTRFNQNGDWSAFPMARDFSRPEIAQWIDRASFKLYLQKAHEKQVGEFGSEGLELKSLLQNIFPDHSWREWISELKTMESKMMWFEERVSDYLSRLKEVIGDMGQLERFLEKLGAFGKEMEDSPLLSSYARQIKLTVDDQSRATVPFQTVKKLREKLSTAHQRTKIELKLIRSLQSGFMEII